MFQVSEWLEVNGSIPGTLWAAEVFQVNFHEYRQVAGSNNGTDLIALFNSFSDCVTLVLIFGRCLEASVESRTRILVLGWVF